MTVHDKIPIAVVGLNFGRHIVQSELLHGPGASFFEVVGVCDDNRERAAGVSEKFGVKMYGDLDEILADPAIPAVGLYTSPAGRADLLRQIIRAGKHVMTTKPFEVDPEEALSVLREARDLGRVVHLNSPAPVMPPDIARILAWQSQHDLGEAVGCRSDVWVSYDERADGTWQDDPARCPVAPIFRLGIYAINDLFHLFGAADEVQVLASRMATGRPTPDNAQLGIRFARGGLANIFASFCVQDGDHYRNGMILNFRRGTVYRNVGPVRSTTAESPLSELTLVTSRDGARAVAEQTVVAASGGNRWDLFYQAVRGESLANEISPEAVVSGLRIIRAMSQAHATGRSVRVG